MSFLNFLSFLKCPIVKDYIYNSIEALRWVYYGSKWIIHDRFSGDLRDKLDTGLKIVYN